MNNALLSSKNMCWCTPPDFFAELDREFHFELDPASTDKSAKCAKYFTPDDDGLKQDWGGIACFAIRHTAGRQRENGSKSVTKKHKKRIRPLLRLYRHVLIQSFFTITYTGKRKSGS